MRLRPRTDAPTVTILTRGDLRASELVRDAVHSNPKIEVHTGMDILDFERADGRLGAVITRKRVSGRDRRFEPAAAPFSTASEASIQTGVPR